MQRPTPATGNWSTAGFDHQTIRQTIRLSTGGRSLRIRLSNQYGTKPLHLTGLTRRRTAPDGDLPRLTADHHRDRPDDHLGPAEGRDHRRRATHDLAVRRRRHRAGDLPRGRPHHDVRGRRQPPVRRRGRWRDQPLGLLPHRRRRDRRDGHRRDVRRLDHQRTQLDRRCRSPLLRRTWRSGSGRVGSAWPTSASPATCCSASCPASARRACPGSSATPWGSRGFAP